MKLKCRIFGHKPDKWGSDGWDVCERCGEHEYHDSWEYWFYLIPSILSKYYGLMLSLTCLKVKILTKLGMVEESEDDLPF